jgi:hypothetical protein
MKLVGTCIAITVLCSPTIAGTCEWHIETIPINLVADQPGEQTFDLPFEHPITLQHVSSFSVDAVKLTRIGSGSVAATIQVLSGGNVIFGFPAGSLSGGAITTSLTGQPGDYVDSSQTADALRVTITNTGSATAELRGNREDDTALIIAVVAPFAPDGPHHEVSLGALPQTIVNAGFASPWDFRFIPPLPADGLRYSVQTGGSFNASGGVVSSIVHSQLVFDNGVMLTNADYYIPSIEQPPPPEERGFSFGGSLLLDEEQSAMIAGSNLIGWRWRLMVSGESGQNGDGTVDVVDLVEVVLAFGTNDSAADVNEDGIVDVEDLVELILNWGPCG